MIETVRCKVLVETVGQYTTGQTIVVPDNKGNVKVACVVDNQRFIDLLMNRILVKG